jgi:hypothetical protein
MYRLLQIVVVLLLFAAPIVATAADAPVQFSGRYAHLATFNSAGECGTGAVVPWADRLWVITYGQHFPAGSDDKLYEIDAELHRAIRPESVGGTPANRMIHRESNQLSIGPYFIDAQRNVRVVPPSKMYGRLTATARHLTEPAEKVYIYDMEGLLYEVHVRTLDVKLLFKRPIPGWHGKGGYSSQGRLVLANNGESAAGSVNQYKPFDYFLDPKPHGPEDAGALADWDGREWRLVERRQFTEVTGPGGIMGPPTDDAPLWANGWDKRSLILKLLDGGRWHTFRLPMADYSYTGHHGWHTEWPRIREVVPASGDKPAKLLMNMHGGWFDFPKTFAAATTGGLRPVGSYLKITGDFCPWQGKIVFGCDDTAKSGFSHGKRLDPMNRLNGQSNSNLWFATWERLSEVGRPAGFGGPWVHDDVKAGEPSAPYLFAGYSQRVLHLAVGQASQPDLPPVAFTIEMDKRGDGQWTEYEKVTVGPEGYAFHVFPESIDAQWVRLKTDRDAGDTSAYFHYGPGGGAVEDRSLFSAVADAGQSGPWSGGVIRSEGVTLGAMLQPVDASGKAGEPRFYQMGPDMKLAPVAVDSPSATFLKENAVVQKDPDIQVDAASAIVVEEKARFRLPKSGDAGEKPWATGWPRAFREIVTERALLDVAGSLYVVPRSISGGVRDMKPVCTHDKRITDFCSWRGLLVVAGCRADATAEGHYIASDDGKVGLWFGDIDDLWKLGKPRGVGGPWLDTPVKAGEPSDPYLMAGYDKKSVRLSHDAGDPVTITIEVDFLADNTWQPCKKLSVAPGTTAAHVFPDGFAAHWVRLRADRDCRATAQFEYK